MTDPRVHKDPTETETTALAAVTEADAETIDREFPGAEKMIAPAATRTRTTSSATTAEDVVTWKITATLSKGGRKHAAALKERKATDPRRKPISPPTTTTLRVKTIRAALVPSDFKDRGRGRH